MEEVLTQVVGNAQSDFLLFFVILAVVMVPIYAMILKDRKQNFEKLLEREKNIIEVLAANTQVLTSLRETLGRDGELISNSIVRVHDRIDELSILTRSQTKTLEKMTFLLSDIAIKLNKD